MSLSLPHAPTAAPPSPASPAPPCPTLLPMHHAVCELVRRDGPDLSQRQLAVLMTLALERAPHTVRGMAARLNISKPAITRAMDRLISLDLARRVTDRQDRRSVLLSIEPSGLQLLAQITRDLSDGALW